MATLRSVSRIRATRSTRSWPRLRRQNMKPNRGTIALIFALIGIFVIEVATLSTGNYSALLKLGALPDDAQLHGEFWRMATFAFLHFNLVHLLVNVALLW